MPEILPDELELTQRIPEKSILGREWMQLKKNRDLYRSAFEASEDKLSFDIGAYRRANMAVDRFIEVWLMRVRKAQEEILTPRAVFSMHTHEIKALRNNSLSRHMIMRIWQRHAVLRYLEILKDGPRKLKQYNPNLLHNIQDKWKTFAREIHVWEKLSQTPFDGSQACSAMMHLLYACHEGAVCND